MWIKLLGGASKSQLLRIFLEEDGGILGMGKTDGFGAGNNDVFFIKLNSDGLIQWTKTFGTSAEEVAAEI